MCAIHACCGCLYSSGLLVFCGDELISSSANLGLIALYFLALASNGGDMFWSFFKKAQLHKAPSSRAQTTSRKHRRLKVDNAHPFRAVKIVCDQHQACEQVQPFITQVFLCSDAPWLPLSVCTHRDSCVCHYQHLDDRRLTLRRDADHGLPNRDIERDRRLEGDRRRQQA